tara:strand:- start:105 stop:500 length:396 start_codon:yes stop_codon:yes gene_type:complete
MNNNDIKDFLIINCTGTNDSIGLKINSNFIIHKLQTKIKESHNLVSTIDNFIKNNKIILNSQFSVLVNLGPGSFSSIRSSIAIAKGIQISKKLKIYGYKDFDLSEFNLRNIELLIEKKLLENKLIKPVYIS